MNLGVIALQELLDLGPMETSVQLTNLVERLVGLGHDTKM
jgi:hypothetical protein